MAENSSIEWTDHTFNPWIGCTKVSPGCDNCYAARQDAFRHWTPEGWGGPRKHTKTWDAPRKWNDAHEAFFAEHGRRQRVFCASLADVFDNEVPPEWRDDLWALIAATPHLDWLLLTKRIGNARSMLPVTWVIGDTQPWPNVWLGATVVNQEEADRDIPKLLAVPARVRFLSIEPMLGPITLRQVHSDMCEIDALTGDHGVLRPLRGRSDAKVHWVICGGESGHNARPMHPDWASSLRDQCAAAGVPFLFKQWGEWIPMMGHAEGVPVRGEKHRHPDGTYMGWAGKKAAGRLLDGVEHNGLPA